MKVSSLMFTTILILASISLPGCANEEAAPTQKEMDEARAKSQKDLKKRGWIDLKPIGAEKPKKGDTKVPESDSSDQSQPDNRSSN